MYQKHIVDLLRGSQELHYSELQPDGVESSHFKYHLDQLQQEGWVTRTRRGVYALTEKGKMAVDRLSVGRINPMQTPKVITYTLLKDTDNYYLYRKEKEPFLGLLNMVAGKVHLDERSYDAALREVDEKTGLTAFGVRHRLIAEVRVRQNDELVSHFVAYVFTAGIENGSPKLEKVSQRELKERQDLAPDLLALIEAINAGESFVDLDLQI